METVLSSSRFESAGFHHIDFEEAVPRSFRVNATNREEFKRWLDIFCELTSSSLNSYKLLTAGHRNEFGQVLVCHHNRWKKQNGETQWKTNTR